MSECNGECDAKEQFLIRPFRFTNEMYTVVLAFILAILISYPLLNSKPILMFFLFIALFALIYIGLTTTSNRNRSMIPTVIR